MIFSLLTVSYNPKPEWLAGALRSAEGLFDEQVFVDDGSNPQIRLKERGTHYIELSENTGQMNARNVGIEAATGDWICTLDDDDEFIRDGVEKLKEFARTTDADIIHFPIVMFGELNGIWGTNPHLKDILEENQIPAGSWYRKSVWEKLKGFQDPLSEDWDFWARATKHKMKFAYFPHPVYRHRMRNDSISADYIGEKWIKIRDGIRNRYSNEQV